MKKNIILVITLAFVFKANAQVRIYNSLSNSVVANSAAFIDATSNSVANASLFAGKGLVFPRLDLSTMTSFGTAVTGIPTSLPTRYDGMIVYNTASSGVAGVGSTQGTLTAGFWYYENKSATTNGGTWKALGSGTGSGTNIYNADGTLAANRTVTMGDNTLTFQGTKPISVYDSSSSVPSSGTELLSLKGLVSDATTGSGPYLTFRRIDGVEMGRIYAINNAGTYDMAFYTGKGSAERMRLKQSGNLEITGQIKISGGSPGAGKVLISDVNGLASWAAASAIGAGDNLGNHTATTALNMNSFNINSAGIITANGNGTNWYSGVFGTSTGNRVLIGNYDGVPAIGGHNNGLNGWQDLIINFGGGNVGIGTTSPSAKLDIAGQIKISGGSPGAGKVLTSDANGLASWTAASAIGAGDNLGNHTATTALNMNSFNINSAGIITANGSGTAWYSGNFGKSTGNRVVIGNLNSVATIGAHANDLGSWQNLAINSGGGNVGIGTDSPAYKLHVGGNLKANSEIVAGGNAYIDGGMLFMKGIEAIWSNGTYFSWGYAGTKNYFNSAVGIGTDSPSDKLHVIGRINATNDSNWIAGSFGTSTGNRVVIGNLGAVATIGAHSSGLDSWQNLAINSGGGNVGIGTTSPEAKLDIAGQIKISGGNPGAGKTLTSDANGLASWAQSTTYRGKTSSISNMATNTEICLGTVCFRYASSGQLEIKPTNNNNLGITKNLYGTGGCSPCSGYVYQYFPGTIWTSNLTIGANYNNSDFTTGLIVNYTTGELFRYSMAGTPSNAWLFIELLPSN